MALFRIGWIRRRQIDRLDSPFGNLIGDCSVVRIGVQPSARIPAVRGFFWPEFAFVAGSLRGCLAGVG